MNPEPETQRSLPAGYRLLEYEILTELGSGGFGITYLARDLNLHREVVIKESLPTFAFRNPNTSRVHPNSTKGEDADLFEWSLDSFIAEARTLARFDHPNIVAIWRVFEANGTAYFVMPRIEGQPFDKVIDEREKAGQPFVEEELLALLLPLLDALENLHRNGYHHRDIKPANLLITENGPILIDFGAARQQISEKTQTVVESAGYTAFEQMQTKGKVGPWSDLYGLGAVLYRALTFETPPKAFDRIGNDPIRSLADDDELSSRCSPVFLESIDRCLSFEAEDRPQSVGELRERLQGGGATSLPTKSSAQSDIPFESKPADSGSKQLAAVRERKGLETSKKSRRSGIVAAIALAMMAGVVTWLVQSSTPNLSITSDPPGAKVFVDGDYSGDLPLELDLPKGNHAIEAHYDPWPAQRKEVRLESGSLTNVAFEFEPVSVRLESDPAGAEVREIDGGKILGKTPLELSDLQPGGVEWELWLDGYHAAKVDAELAPGVNELLPPILSPLMEGKEAGQERTFGGIEMIWCPPGSFLMGSPYNEDDRDVDETQHEVTLTTGFWLAKFECTQGQWKKIMENNPSYFLGSMNLPVEKISWEDVQEWLARMNKTNPLGDGWEWNLPSEPQWEYACRAGTETATAFGDSLSSDQANFNGNLPYGNAPNGRVLSATSDVGDYEPNAWGLYDMHGNVWEWCRNSYGKYPLATLADPASGPEEFSRMNRGGSFYSPGHFCRSAHRDWYHFANKSSSGGFRPAITPTQ